EPRNVTVYFSVCPGYEETLAKVIVSLTDITERKRAEEAQQRLNRELRAISDCNQTLMRADNEQSLLDSICRIICDEAGYRMAWVGFAENDAAKTVRPVAWAGAEEGYLELGGFTWADTELGQGPCGIAIRSGNAACIEDFISDPQVAPWRDNALQRDYRSSIALPLKDESANTFGVLNIYSDQPNTFTADEKRLLEELAGDLAFGIAALRTRTERKLVEEELRRYRDQLEDTVQQRTAELLLARNAADAANKAKSLFLANMSHELRTPLNAILGFSGMMRRDPQLTDSQRENLDIINRSGEHLLTLINDVLEIAKIEAGRLQLEVAPLDLGGMVRDVTEMMQLRAQEKGLRLQIDQTSEFPRFIRGDEARLRQILVNLVGNAVKFTAQGGVTIRLGIKNNARQHLLIEVADTGPGISPEDQKRLFEPFVQLTEGTAQHGTGLGLSITRQFVQLMGGNIAIDSAPGKGARFRVDLPLELASAADMLELENRTHGEIAGLAPGQPRYRILIAEDQHENQLLLARLMSDIGLEVKVAEDGVKCIQIFRDWHPDLIWMDKLMPVMDGVEATRRIRQLPDGQKVKIVAVTASAFKEQLPELLDAGMNECVSKPYRFNEIYDSLARQLDVKYIYQSGETKELPPVALTPDKLLVLPVDLRLELQHALENLDSERIAASIHRVGEIDAELGRTLSRLAEYFDYPAILNALAEAALSKGGTP
ncbi:MAG TPA: ATP-binding protein, partial [Gallionella sp.]|nr:ATP-binding protein [Gallionella sp.]